jgi:hypothetical protein
MVRSVLAGHFAVRMDHEAGTGCKLINAAVDAGAPVVVVARRNPADLSSIDPYLANAANVSVVAVALDGTSACLHAFKPARQNIEDVSADQIFTTIASAAMAGR